MKSFKVLAKKDTIGKDGADEAQSKPSSMIYGPSMLDSKYQKSPVQSRTPDTVNDIPPVYIHEEAKTINQIGEVREEEQTSCLPSSAVVS